MNIKSMDIAQRDKVEFNKQTGDASHVVIDKEVERLVGFVPKNDREAEKSPAWCASAWRQIKKFDKHGPFKIVKDEGQRRGRTLWVRTNKTNEFGHINNNNSTLVTRTNGN